MKDIARRLRYRNVAISIDKLGLGWPTLRELREFPFVELKVDARFVAQLLATGHSEGTTSVIWQDPTTGATTNALLSHLTEKDFLIV